MNARRLVFFYERRIAPWLNRVLPLRLRAWGTRRLFERTRHPDLGFAHARQLIALGQSARAAQLYADGQTHSIHDPLFACSADLVPSSDLSDSNSATDVSGRMQASFGYRGMILDIAVQTAVPFDTLELCLDGRTIRSERLKWRGAEARFSYLITRDALDQFPVQSLLSLRSPADHAMTAPDIRLHIPHGTGEIFDQIAARGALNKKGALAPDPADVMQRQEAYLALYTEARAAFAAEGYPLLILYGTLLGQARSGDFIPGDDDFDVGYPSRCSTPQAIKAEAVDLIRALAKRGLSLSVNAEGKPFRIHRESGDKAVYLDARPVFTPQPESAPNQVWLHKQADLPLPLSDFETPAKAHMRGTEVLTPKDPVAFLSAYYGAGWAVPDPGFSNAGKPLAPDLVKTLRAICLTHAEQSALKAQLGSAFAPLAFEPLYPVWDDGDA